MKIKVNADEFMSKYVKVTASIEDVTALAIGEVKDFARLQDEALAKAFSLAGCTTKEPVNTESDVVPEAEALPPVFTDEQEEEPLPGQISLDVEVEAETSEEDAELATEKVAEAALAEDDDEDDDPFSFLDETFEEDEDEAPAKPAAEPVADEEPEQEEEPAPAPKKRGRPRKAKAEENGMTREKALATIVEVTSEATSAFRDLAGMTMGELLEKKPTMAKIMIRDHIKPQLSKETVEAAKCLA